MKYSIIISSSTANIASKSSTTLKIKLLKLTLIGRRITAEGNHGR
jgi:hypothetical protein